MNMTFSLIGLFFFAVIAFIGGMFLLPELFGISKSKEAETSSDEETNDEK